VLETARSVTAAILAILEELGEHVCRSIPRTSGVSSCHESDLHLAVHALGSASQAVKEREGLATQSDFSVPGSPSEGNKHHRHKILELPPGICLTRTNGDLRKVETPAALQTVPRHSVSWVPTCIPAGRIELAPEQHPHCLQQGMEASASQDGHGIWERGEVELGAVAAGQNADSSISNTAQRLIPSERVKFSSKSPISDPLVSVVPLGAVSRPPELSEAAMFGEMGLHGQQALQFAHLGRHQSLESGQPSAAVDDNIAHLVRTSGDQSCAEPDVQRHPPWLGRACLPEQKPPRPRSAMPLGRANKQSSACIRPHSAGCKQMFGITVAGTASQQGATLVERCRTTFQGNARKNASGLGVGRQLIFLPEDGAANRQHAKQGTHMRPCSVTMLRERIGHACVNGIHLPQKSSKMPSQTGAWNNVGIGTRCALHGSRQLDDGNVQVACRRVRTRPASARNAPSFKDRMHMGVEAGTGCTLGKVPKKGSPLEAGSLSNMLEQSREWNTWSSRSALGWQTCVLNQQSCKLLPMDKAFALSAVQPITQDAILAARQARGAERWGALMATGSHRRRRCSLGACSARPTPTPNCTQPEKWRGYAHLHIPKEHAS
jgi:hypothetical protein